MPAGAENCPSPLPSEPKLPRKVPSARVVLDAAQVLVGGVDRPVRGDRDASRGGQQVGPRGEGLALADRGGELAVGRELLDAVVGAVGDVDEARAVDGELTRIAELAGAAAVVAEGGHEAPGRGPHRDARVRGVSVDHVEVAVGTDGHPLGHPDLVRAARGRRCSSAEAGARWCARTGRSRCTSGRPRRCGRPRRRSPARRPRSRRASGTGWAPCPSRPSSPAAAAPPARRGQRGQRRDGGR